MKSAKPDEKKSKSKPLQAVAILKCSFMVPTEDRKGVYLIVDAKDRESVYQVDGYGSDFCRRVDGAISSEEIADELIQKHNLPEAEFKEYVTALQKDLQENGLLTFQRS